MEKENVKHLTIRIDETLLKKFRYVASYDDRSANGQVLMMIREQVRAFEEKFGEITLNDETPEG